MTLPHGGNIYHYSRKYGIPAGEILDFSASVNPLGPSPRAVVALRAAARGLDSYPDPDSRELVEAIAARHGIRTGCVLAGNGSTEFIYMLPRVLRPGRVIVMSPGFSDYERAARVAGLAVKRIPLSQKRGFVPDIGRIIGSLSSSDMLFFCNPNNPTGVLVEKPVVMDLLTAAKKAGAFVVLDEAFIEYAPGGSVIREASCTGWVAVLRNFTKFYGLAGLRAGYLVGAPSLVDRLRKAREPWTVNTPAQAAAAASLSDTGYEKRSLCLMESERRRLFAELSSMPGLHPYPAFANFILVRLDTGPGAEALTEELASRGLLVRDCSNFRGLDGMFIRVAVRTGADNDALLGALKSLDYFTAR